MAEVANYEPNEAGWRALALSPQLLEACLTEARRGRTFAFAISPVETGKYRSSFNVEPTTAMFRRGPRVAANLYNDDEAAAPLEFGNARVTRPHRILGRTAAYLGSR